MRRAARAWGLGLAGFALVAAPWVGVLSATLGRLTFGTAAATSYALVGPGSGDARWEAIRGLRRPPPDAYSVWQDATARPAVPGDEALSPFRSRAALERQLRVAAANARAIAGHLASLDEFCLGLAALGLLPLALAATWRRREAALRYAILLLAVLVFCGGYAFIQAENARYFWFVFFVLTAAAFHFADALSGALARRATPRGRGLVAAAAGVAVAVSFAFHPARSVADVLRQPSWGREHRLVAERLAEWGVAGPLAAAGERGWWNGLHTAYYLDAKYAGAPRATDATGIAAEMRDADAATLLVWGDLRLAPALRADRAFEFVGAIPAGSLTSLEHDVAVFRLRER